VELKGNFFAQKLKVPRFLALPPKAAFFLGGVEWTRFGLL